MKSKFSTTNKNYQVYKDFIWNHYNFASFMKKNQYNYLYGLLTGTSAYTNSAGNAGWAREELISAYYESVEAEYVAAMALGYATNVSMRGSVGNQNKTKSKSSSGCNCFVAGTKVQTDEGEKPIEEIEVGDKVLAKDENNPDGELAYKEVTGLYRNLRDDIIKLHVGEQIIETTDNHPFWVEGKGWVFADKLQAGDKLQKANGSNLTIDKVEFVKLDEPVA
ncbi:polymorphic toxin-type HINT domain-containing protein [Paenibacillus sp. FSL L8-0436]|uniref:polymorphic toxin-type HINT domain-containing protein n=1 Tax=Paenibacillus sp. FSL L8-0436 TaxID=2954686 RepID=UPI003158114A